MYRESISSTFVCVCSILKITFQLIDNQLTPISVSPAEVRLNEYKIDFNTARKTITNVWHKVDGAVR